MFASGDVMKVSLRLPDQMTGVINGLLLLCIICTEPLLRWRFVQDKSTLTPLSLEKEGV